MKHFNKIRTDAEYMAQGFEPWEVPYARKHDELFNQYQAEDAWDTLTEDQWEEYNALVHLLHI